MTECLKTIDIKKFSVPKKRSNIPGAPARARTAYLIFSEETRATLKDEDGKPYGFTESGKIVGEKWRSLSEEGKAKYYEAAKEDKKRFVEEMKAFDPNFVERAPPEEVKDDLQRHMIGLEDAINSSADKNVIMCHNVSTFRRIKYNTAKPSPNHVWDVDNHLCANTAEELDEWKAKLVKEKVITEEETKKTKKSKKK